MGVASCDCLVNIDYRIRLRALRQQKHPLPTQPGKKPMAMVERGGEGVTKLVSWGGSISGHNANEPNSSLSQLGEKLYPELPHMTSQYWGTSNWDGDILH